MIQNINQGKDIIDDASKIVQLEMRAHDAERELNHRILYNKAQDRMFYKVMAENQENIELVMQIRKELKNAENRIKARDKKIEKLTYKCDRLRFKLRRRWNRFKKWMKKRKGIG
jgi:deoxyadenosine/deoxycytidine kinase